MSDAATTGPAAPAPTASADPPAGGGGHVGGGDGPAPAPARTVRGVPGPPLDPSANLTDLVVRAARRDPGFPLLRRRTGEGWSDVAAAEFEAAVRALAAGLVAAGVAPGDRVALMSRTRYEWTLVDVAVWFAGAVTVPVYETSSAEQVAWVLSDSGARACVVETAAHARLVAGAGAGGGAPALEHVWTIEDGDLDALAAPGPQDAVDASALEARRTLAGADDLATIIYTSGTTGRPKGARLTHGNFLSLAEAAVADVPEVFADADGSCLLFLPLAHVFARFVQVLCLASPMTLGHTADMASLTDDLAAFRPTFVLAVPRVFEKLHATAEQRAVDAGRGRLFARAVDVAVATSEAEAARRDGGAGPGARLRVEHAVFDRLVYSRLRAALGGRARWAVSGGGALSPRLGHFFRGAGTTVLQGWGLTETTAPTCVNRPGRDRVDTVGVPLPGCAVRVDASGEVLVAGPHVTPGYWGSSSGADEEAFVVVGGERWLRTGDLGRVDAAGHLEITGRLKEIIVTAGGKNVSPALLEDRLRTHPLVGQALVVGDGRPFVAALVALDAEALPGWFRSRGRAALDVAAASRDADVLAAVQEAVDAANAAVSRAESVRAVRVLDHDLAPEHFTPSLKLRRRVVLGDLAEDVEALYAPRTARSPR